MKKFENRINSFSIKVGVCLFVFLQFFFSKIIRKLLLDISSLIAAYYRVSSTTSERAYQVTLGQVRICPPPLLINFIFIFIFILFYFTFFMFFQFLLAILLVVLLGSHLFLHQKMVRFKFSFMRLT